MGIRTALLFQNLGVVFFELGQWRDSAEALESAIASGADSAEIWMNLGHARAKLGDWPAARDAYAQSVSRAPSNASALAELGLARHRARDLAGAQDAYRKALALKPDDAGLWNNLGAAAQESGNPDAAIAAFRRASELAPDYAPALANLGSALADIGERSAAREAFARAVALDPANAGARLGACFAELPILYDTPAQIDQARAAYTRALDALIAACDPADPAVAAAVGQHHPFYLPYQGQDDAALQRRYGAFVGQAMAHAYPQWAGPLAPPPRAADGRLRVAFVSAYFRDHSVWKLFRGWMEGLDPARFERMGYWTSPAPDAQTPAARACFERFAEGGFETVAQALERDRPHVVIYPELGMDPICHRLACLRFAPVQCVAWGHPETTGFATIDYFLTSDLMEPPDEAARYTERVVRLPHLSIDYAPPAGQAERTPAAFGLRDGAMKYLCCQSIFKYLPQDDDLLARIAGEVPDSQFVFLGHPTAPALTARFRARLSAAFQARALDPVRHLVFVPWLDRARYAALNASCDLFLDTPRWSGGNTTLEAIAQGLPAITWPGPTMRARHTYAILRRMELDDAIAPTPDEYVDLAVRLGRDKAALADLNARTRARRAILWRDRAPVAFLANFLERAAGGTA
ncbi:MAG: tetratricopeptide repeat protein [Tagaea sp.]|nr:tetratricopeptide repeat protein [Tagaea sp.]